MENGHEEEVVRSGSACFGVEASLWLVQICFCHLSRPPNLYYSLGSGFEVLFMQADNDLRQRSIFYTILLTSSMWLRVNGTWIGSPSIVVVVSILKALSYSREDGLSFVTVR